MPVRYVGISFLAIPALMCSCLALLGAQDLSKEEIGAIEKGVVLERRSQRVKAVSILAERQGPLALAMIGQLTAHPDWMVRETAVLATPQQDPKEALKMVRKLEDERDPRVRAAIAIAAAHLGSQQPVEDDRDAERDRDRLRKSLLELAADDEPRVRAAAARALGTVDIDLLEGRERKRAVETLGNLMLDDSVHVGMATVATIADMPTTDVALTQALMHALGHAAEPVAFEAATVLATHPIKGMERDLQKVLRAVDKEQRPVAVAALGYIRLPLVDDLLMSATRDRDWEVRAAAYEAMGHIKPDAGAQLERWTRFREACREGVEDKEWGVKTCAVFGLARLGAAEDVHAMLSGLEKTTSSEIGFDRFYFEILRECMDGPQENDGRQWAEWYTRQDGKPSFRPFGQLGEEASLSFYSVAETSANFCFVIDNSGSMRQNRKLVRAKEELLQAAEDLRFHTLFSVVRFDNIATPWRPHPLPGHFRNKFKLVLKMRDTVPEESTNIHDALDQALDQWGVEACYLLTDGEPTKGITNRERLVELITEKNFDKRVPTRIHTLALDQAKGATAFLEELSNRNMGIARLVQPANP